MCAGGPPGGHSLARIEIRGADRPAIIVEREDHIIGRVLGSRDGIEPPYLSIFWDVDGMTLISQFRWDGVEDIFADVLDVGNGTDRSIIEEEVVRPHPEGDAPDG